MYGHDGVHVDKVFPKLVRDEKKITEKLHNQNDHTKCTCTGCNKYILHVQKMYTV